MAKQLKGDINNDGKIDYIDFAICLAASSGYLSLDVNEALRADVNNNGKVNAEDGRAMLQHIIGEKLIDEVVE